MFHIIGAKSKVTSSCNNLQSDEDLAEFKGLMTVFTTKATTGLLDSCPALGFPFHLKRLGGVPKLWKLMKFFFFSSYISAFGKAGVFCPTGGASPHHFSAKYCFLCDHLSQCTWSALSGNVHVHVQQYTPHEHTRIYPRTYSFSPAAVDFLIVSLARSSPLSNHHGQRRVDSFVSNWHKMDRYM